MHYTCIACITIDSVMRIDKKPSAGLFKEMQTQDKENTDVQIHKREVKSDPDSELESDSEAESKSHTELMAKLKSNSDPE